MDGFSYEYLPKAAVYAGSQLAIGIAMVRWLLRDSERGGASGRASTERWFVRCAVANGLVLVALLLVRAWAHTAAVFGAEEAWNAGNIRLVALESRWGLRWQWQVYAALLLSFGAIATRRYPIAWPVYASGALALTTVMPLLGHAAGAVGRHLLHATHLLASAIWIGSLGVIVLMALSRRPIGSHADLSRSVQRFSPLALASASFVLISGIVAAFLYRGSWGQVWSTAYGRILTVKVALVALVLLCGWRNWRQARSHRPPVTSMVVLEYLFALAVAVVTGALTETEHP